MKAFHLFLLLGVSLVATSFAYPTQRIAYPTPHSWFEERVDLAEAEQPRIQRHLAAVEAELRARPTAGLNESQRRNRLARLDDLHAYWARGEFPQNLDFPNRLIPYFIDAKGVPCAMGYLVIQSGHKDFAEEIRVRMNNAYIGEIAAVDNRLAEWGEENGMTLEEAAMVQPTYGGPMIHLYQVRTDGLSRPWVLGPRNGDAIPGPYGYLAYYDSTRWGFEGSIIYSSFCLMKSGPVLTLSSSSVQWRARTYSFARNMNTCGWTANDSDAWVGGQQGLVRLRRTGSMDTLTRTVFTTPMGSSDTITGVAVTTDAVWAATDRGVYRRRLATPDSITTWDSLAVWGKRITGIKASGTRVWLGIEGVVGLGRPTSFSTRGLRRYNGTGWSAFVASQSSIQTPGDTIYALAERDTGSIWVASPVFGFARFNGVTTVKVADIPAGQTVYDMTGTAGGFYAGTSNGLYQFRNDSLIHIGSPSTSLRPAIAGKGSQTGPRIRVLSAQEAKALGNVRSVLGQKTGPQAGAGVYIVPD